MAAAFLFVSSPPTISTITSSNPNSCPNFSTSIKLRSSLPATSYIWPRRHFSPIAALQLISHETLTIDKFSLNVAEAFSEDELWAASCLRVRSFYDFQPSSFGIEDHKKYLAEREFEALKERVAGKRVGFKRVSCINATLPLSQMSSLTDNLSAACKDHKKYLAEREFEALKERVAGKRVGFKRVSCINATLPLSQMSSLTDNLSAACKFSDDGEDRVVVGTLDLNQCVRLPDEITGKKPEGIGADFARAYVSNVCVAEELQRNGLGFALVAKSKIVAEEWGISDLYVHVAVDNEPAKHLYLKSCFVYESDEPAWQARFLDRPRRILLWAGIPHAYVL